MRIWREWDRQSLDLIFNNKRKRFALSVVHDRSPKKGRESPLHVNYATFFARPALFSGIASEHRYQNKIKKFTRERAGPKSAASSEKKGELCYTRRWIKHGKKLYVSSFISIRMLFTDWITSRWIINKLYVFTASTIACSQRNHVKLVVSILLHRFFSLFVCGNGAGRDEWEPSRVENSELKWKFAGFPRVECGKIASVKVHSELCLYKKVSVCNTTWTTMWQLEASKRWWTWWRLLVA